MTSFVKILNFINENGLEVLDKFFAILTLTGEDAGKVKALWDLWEDLA